MSDYMDCEPVTPSVSLDSDGDGMVDMTVTDFDGDGIADMIVTEGAGGLTAVLDKDLDGSYERVLLDQDGDGIFETELTDTDGDAVLDTIAIDVDGDGLVDALDYIEAGTPEELPEEPSSAPHVIADTDSVPPSPGSSDTTAPEAQPPLRPGSDTASDQSPVPTMTVSEAPEELEPSTAPHVIADTENAPSSPGSSDTTEASVELDGTDTIWGDPAAESAYWFNQAENGYCVPASVAQIVGEFTGQPLADESAFVQRAIELELLTENGRFGRWSGMSALGAETLLESFGVEAQVATGTLQDLAGLLDSGHDVILFVDSSEVWTGIDDDVLEPAAMDHALVVTGIDFENGLAYLSDPGDPNGDGRVISLDLLDDAWADGNREMVVTSAPAPGGSAGAGLVSADSSGVVLLPVVLDDQSISLGGRRAP